MGLFLTQQQRSEVTLAWFVHPFSSSVVFQNLVATATGQRVPRAGIVVPEPAVILAPFVLAAAHGGHDGGAAAKSADGSRMSGPGLHLTASRTPRGRPSDELKDRQALVSSPAG